MLRGAGVVGIKSRALSTFSVLGVRILIIFGFTFSSVEEITPTAGEVRWFEKARQLWFASTLLQPLPKGPIQMPQSTDS